MDDDEISKSYDDHSEDRYFSDNRNAVNDAKKIEYEVFAFFKDKESNPYGHRVVKISDREYQVNNHSMFPILVNENVMLTTPNGKMTMFEFYKKFLDKKIDKKADKLISSQKDSDTQKHFIFSDQQFEFSNDVLENSRSINSRFEVEETPGDEDKIEFRIEDDGINKNDKVSFLDSIGSDDSYMISNKLQSKNTDEFAAPYNQLPESSEKNKVKQTGSPLADKKDKKIPSKSVKVDKKTKSRIINFLNKRD